MLLALMQAQRAIVTLAGPPQLTSTEQWAQIWAGFSAQFPLRNLHWKPATRTSIRTIQSLDVSILALQSFKEEGASQIPSSLLERPLLNLYAVTCEVCCVYLQPCLTLLLSRCNRIVMHTKLRSRNKSRTGIVRFHPANARSGSSSWSPK